MSTAVALRAITADEYVEFRALAEESYASDNVAAGRWQASEALRLARDEADTLLPRGMETPGHHLRGIVAEPDECLVGFVWFAAVGRGSQSVAFIYELIVKPEHRRRGYGRAALLATEHEARSAGYAGMALHVFAQNAGATALYRSVGFEVSSLNMQKPFLAQA
jgi:ribosomal protein S18 acetylase RimI-like enzyme